MYRLLVDRADIYSYKDIKVGSITKKQKMLVAENVECKYRKRTISAIENGVPVLTTTHTLITKTDCVAKEGDKVIITLVDGTKVSLTLGEKIVCSAIPHYEYQCTRDAIV